MDLDHVRGDKQLSLSQWAIGRISATDDDVTAELAKCDVRCACCHRIRHEQERLDYYGNGSSDPRLPGAP